MTVWEYGGRENWDYESWKILGRLIFFIIMEVSYKYNNYNEE